MPTDYSASPAGPLHGVIQVPSDGDVRNVASVNTPLEALADNDVYLNATKGTKAASNTWTATNLFQGLVTLEDGLRLLSKLILRAPVVVSPTSVTQVLQSTNGPIFLLSEPTGGGGAGIHFIKLGIAGVSDGDIIILSFTTLQVGTLAGEYYDVRGDYGGASQLIRFDDRGVDVDPADPITDNQNIPVGTGAVFRYSTSDSEWHYILGWGYVKPA